LGITDIFCKDLFTSRNLVDVKPSKVVPTWKNGRRDREAITRRLDRVLVSEDLLSLVGLYRIWVELSFISDHAPIIFQLNLPPCYKASPFKLNAQWMEDPTFVELVHVVWKDLTFLSESGRQQRLLWKLKVLKSRTKSWYKVKLNKNSGLLSTLEMDIKEATFILATDPLNHE